MKNGSKILFSVITVLIVMFAYMAYFGIHSQYGDVKKTYIRGAQDINWGMEVEGGFDISLTAPPDVVEAAKNSETPESETDESTSEGAESESLPAGDESLPEESEAVVDEFKDYPASEQLVDAKTILEKRVLFLGLTDARVSANTYSGTYNVKFAGTSQEELAKALAAQGYFEVFVDNKEEDADAEETAKTPLMTNKHISEIGLVYNSQNMPSVQIILTKEGAKILEEITAEIAATESEIYFTIDGEEVMRSTVGETITTGIVHVSSYNMTQEAASLIVVKLKAGALPFTMELQGTSPVQPTVVKETVKVWTTTAMITAAVAAIILVLVFRLSGAIGILSSVLQIALIFMFVTGFLPDTRGIISSKAVILAGVLSVGFGILSTMIYSTTIKDELISGIGETNLKFKTGISKANKMVGLGAVAILLISVVMYGVFGFPGTMFNTLFKPVTFWLHVSPVPYLRQFFQMLSLGMIALMISFNIVYPFMIKRLRSFAKKDDLYGGKK